jgi:hypothetical protein
MFLLAKPVYANCPVCILTVGGGLFIAKKLGIDDLLVSIWISGLNSAIAFWIASTIKNRIINNPFLWSLMFYFFSMTYFFYSKQIGHPVNKLYGLDKIIVGMTVGLLTFFVAFFIDKFIRFKNGGKVLFPYQKVIIPLVALTAVTYIFRSVL